MADGSVAPILPALEQLERLSAFIPPARIHRHRSFGVLAPNAPLRPALTALASARAEADSERATSSSACKRADGATSEPSPSEEKPRRPAVYSLGNVQCHSDQTPFPDQLRCTHGSASGDRLAALRSGCAGEVSAGLRIEEVQSGRVQP